MPGDVSTNFGNFTPWFGKVIGVYVFFELELLSTFFMIKTDPADSWIIDFIPISPDPADPDDRADRGPGDRADRTKSTYSFKIMIKIRDDVCKLYLINYLISNLIRLVRKWNNK